MEKKWRGRGLPVELGDGLVCRGFRLRRLLGAVDPMYRLTDATAVDDIVATHAEEATAVPVADMLATPNAAELSKPS